MDPSSSGSPRSAELALADDAPSNTTAATTTTATATATPDAPAPAPAAGDAGADAEAAADVAADTDTAHLARFEFSNDGTTKILMVEWYPDTVPSGSSGTSVPATTTAGDSGHDGDHHHAVTSGPGASPASDVASPAWQVSWPGKSTTLPARDADADGARRRVYFLLPPDASIPATVTITPPGRSSFDLKPLPAIFPEGFAEEAGTRGVLHTIWARKRLSELEREMEAELRANAESVGLEMAMAEKQWIVDNFIRSPVLPQPPSPVVARSPGGVNRLGDKLKGLKLATSPADLAPSPTANTFTSAGSQAHTFSPGGADIAVSSFAAISGPRQAAAAPISLDAAIKGEVPTAVGFQRPEGQDTEDDLFALPMSPRSPEMAKSPFSALR